MKKMLSGTGYGAGPSGPAEPQAITAGNGGDYTYCKLRDLGLAPGFYTGWVPDSGITINTK